MYLGRDSLVSVFMIFAVSVDGKSLVWAFALCIWDMTGLLHHCWCGKEGISLRFCLVLWFALIPLLCLLLLFYTTHIFSCPSLTLLSHSSRKKHNPDPGGNPWLGPRWCSQTHWAGPWLHAHCLSGDIRNDKWDFPLAILSSSSSCAYSSGAGSMATTRRSCSRDNHGLQPWYSRDRQNVHRRRKACKWSWWKACHVPSRELCHLCAWTDTWWVAGHFFVIVSLRTSLQLDPRQSWTLPVIIAACL